MSLANLITDFLNAAEVYPYSQFKTKEEAQASDGYDAAAGAGDRIRWTRKPPVTAYAELNAFLAKLPARWGHGGDTPKTAQDVSPDLVMPLRIRFKDDANYGRSALHEAMHWIGFWGEGHIGRPVRDYRLEEAITETTTALIAEKLGVPIDRNNSLDYVAGWMHADPQWQDILRAVVEDGKGIYEQVNKFRVAKGVEARYNLAMAIINGR